MSAAPFPPCTIDDARQLTLLVRAWMPLVHATDRRLRTSHLAFQRAEGPAKPPLILALFPARRRIAAVALQPGQPGIANYEHPLLVSVAEQIAVRNPDVLNHLNQRLLPAVPGVGTMPPLEPCVEY